MIDLMLQEQLRAELQRKKSELAKKMGALETTPDFGSDMEDEDEETNETDALGTNLGIREIVKENYLAVEKALERMEKGTYGICAQCGKEIEPEILRLEPESALCRSCKQSAS